MHLNSPFDPKESNLQQMTTSGVDLPRRHYVVAPQDGGRNEWRSLIKHYEEADQKSRLVESYAK